MCIKELSEMEKHYTAPTVEMTEFQAEDIMTTSGGIVLPDDNWDE